uniref:Uncharacterized protein n=1 Tax=Lepisosteus oculatus TaxID=7918 RepID=W5M4Y4_LEPOC
LSKSSKDGINIELFDPFLLEYVFVNGEVSRVGLGLGENTVSSVCHDLWFPALLAHTRAAQHVHGCSVY